MRLYKALPNLIDGQCGPPLEVWLLPISLSRLALASEFFCTKLNVRKAKKSTKSLHYLQGIRKDLQRTVSVPNEKWKDE